MLTREMPCSTTEYAQACLYPEARFQKQTITLVGTQGHPENIRIRTHREAKLQRQVLAI